MKRKSPDPAQPAEQASGETTRAPRRGGDPVVRWLTLVMLLAAVVFAATALSLVLFVRSVGDAPRSAVERQVDADEVAAKEKPQDVQNWARLALSYAHAGRWADADYAIAQGRAIQKSAILDLTEADVLRLKGDKGAVAAYDRAIVSAKAEYAVQVKRLLEKKMVDKPPPDYMLIQALAGRALALEQAGKRREAAEQASEAVAMDPTDADLRVTYGDLLHALKRDAEAEAQYRAALVYAPELPSAVGGLEAIGKEP